MPRLRRWHRSRLCHAGPKHQTCPWDLSLVCASPTLIGVSVGPGAGTSTGAHRAPSAPSRASSSLGGHRVPRRGRGAGESQLLAGTHSPRLWPRATLAPGRSVPGRPWQGGAELSPPCRGRGSAPCQTTRRCTLSQLEPPPGTQLRSWRAGPWRSRSGGRPSRQSGRFLAGPPVGTSSSRHRERSGTCAADMGPLTPVLARGGPARPALHVLPAAGRPRARRAPRNPSLRAAAPRPRADFGRALGAGPRPCLCWM